ncbi:hypothetical protein [Breznakia pachnodae]|uniref:DUF1430 domain-containing protein n=1 Tax=Breznakia pachnodae TaxID=265178 RepID=A0ABU0E456_9FIRM|nr:hypothetical protein [Breznakia pachnodae]MDQ0361590.1 hypothetical protein [Breznakia pachnodae]
MKLLRNAKKIMVLFIFVFSIGLSIFYHDAVEEKKYYSIENMDYEVIDIKFSEDYTKDDFTKLFEMAENNQVILLKNEVQYTSGIWVNNIYISSSSLEDILNRLNLKYTINNNDKKNDLASTENGKNAKYELSDFLNNDHFNIYTIDKLIDNNRYLYADYLVYYSNETNLNDFMDDSKVIFGDDLILTETGMMDFHETSILQIGIIVFLITFMIYIVIELFYVYNKAKKISIMQLLGISDKRIAFLFIKKELPFYLLLALVLLVLTNFLIPNITLSILISIAILCLIIISIFCILTLVSVIVINHLYSMVDLLKSKSIIDFLTKVGTYGKLILNVLFILTALVAFSTTSQFVEHQDIVDNTQRYANYGYFTHINMSNEQYNDQDHTALNELYKELQKTELDTQYIESAQYIITAPEDIEYTNAAIEQGEYFPIISVNVNYLNMNNITIYDSKDKLVTFNEEEFERFLFPKEYVEYYDAFKEFYLNEQAEYPDVKSNFDLYTYEATKLPTLSTSNSGSTAVDSKFILKEPIIRVIYSDYPVNYIDDMYGISTAGVGEETGLKIDASIGKEATYDRILPILKEANIDKILTIDSFTTIGEVAGLKSSNTEMILYVESIVLILIFAIYSVMTFEIDSLFIEKSKRRMLVMTFLGFKNKDIFKSIFIYNLKLLAMSVGIFIAINIFVTSIINIVFIAVVLGMFIYEQIILMIAIRYIRLDKVATLLKGE